MFEATGRGAPQGKTVRNPRADGRTAVTLNIAALASASTPPRPATRTSTVRPAATLPTPANNPSTVDSPKRESINRTGPTAANPGSPWDATPSVSETTDNTSN